MYLDYSKLEFDKFGRPEKPELQLRTLGGEIIGILPFVHDLTFNIKYSEPSEISFKIPRYNEGKLNPFFERTVGYKIIWTKHYGIYVVKEPENTSDGIEDETEVNGYSIEQLLENKRFFLEEGTFNFYGPGFAGNNDTLIGRILEVAIGWNVGYIAPSLYGRYRTFDEFDDNLLSLIYDTIPEKYHCVIVFDPYKMTINAYDAQDETDPDPNENAIRRILPIYLGFDNLLSEIQVKELTDEMVTAIRPYGADNVNIRDVNPIGTDWIYDLSYFIEIGDLHGPLATKYEAWQRSIQNEKARYTGLTGLRASATLQELTANAKLTDLQGEETDLLNQQSVIVQSLAMEITETGLAYQQGQLDAVNKKLMAKKDEIADKEREVQQLEDDIESYNKQIKEIVDRLSIKNYFTEDEYKELSNYFIEDDFQNETFVATDLDTTITGDSYVLDTGTISVTGTEFSQVDFGAEYAREMYTMKGGTFTMTGSQPLTCDIIHGTLEVRSNKAFVMSLYAGTITTGEATAPSGVLTFNGNVMTNFKTDAKRVDDHEIITYEGTEISFNMGPTTMFITADVSEYQKYSVESELYDFAVKSLHKLATPTYEFEVESGNFIFDQEFKPFRDKLELGSAVYLKLADGHVITPIMIEIELDFEDESEFCLVFSNQFKRHDAINTLKNMIGSSYSSSRSFDASKHVYNATVGQQPMISQFMNSSLDAARNAIVSSKNQSVTINGAGIQVGGDSKYQMRIIDSMIAMTDDGWQHAKLAIGRFSSPEVGEYWGVNADVIGGKMLIGNNLIIENRNDTGVMQFRVDASGAWLYNSTFVLVSDYGGKISLNSANPIMPIADTFSGGKIIIDPRYGIVAGNGNLFTTSGTTVTPSFIQDDGSLELDEDYLPKNANFFLDIRDGNAYFRGRIKATKGKIGGWTIEDDYLYAGSGSTRVGMNAGAKYDPYAFWAGGDSPVNANFWVKKNGDIYANNGTFRGTVNTRTFLDPNKNNQAMMQDGKFIAEYLDLYGITIRRKSNNTISFQVDAQGNVTISGAVTMGAGSSISWGNIDETGSDSYGMAQDAQDAADKAQGSADEAAKAAGDAADDVLALAAGTYSKAGKTFINEKMIYSPNIFGGAYWDNDGNVKLILDPTAGGYADLKLVRLVNGRQRNVFTLEDTGTSLVYHVDENRFLSTMAIGGDTENWIFGTWHFGGAKIDGLNVTAKFA